MVQRLDQLSLNDADWILPSPSSVIEIMLQLLGVDRPHLTAESLNAGLHWRELIDRTFDGFVLRRMEGTIGDQNDRLAEELKAERPVGLILQEVDPSTGQSVERGWVLLRLHQVGPYVFLDAVRRHPESVAPEGRFTERRVLRLDQMAPGQIEAIVYCQPLTEAPTAPRRGRTRGQRP